MKRLLFLLLILGSLCGHAQHLPNGLLMPVNNIVIDTTRGSDTAFLKMGYLNYISIATPTLHNLVVVFPCVPIGAAGYIPQGQNDFYNTGSICVDLPVKFTSPKRPSFVKSVACTGGTYFQGGIICETPNIGGGSCTPAGCYDLSNQQWDLWAY